MLQPAVVNFCNPLRCIAWGRCAHVLFLVTRIVFSGIIFKVKLEDFQIAEGFYRQQHLKQSCKKSHFTNWENMKIASHWAYLYFNAINNRNWLSWLKLFSRPHTHTHTSSDKWLLLFCFRITLLKTMLVLCQQLLSFPAAHTVHCNAAILIQVRSLAQIWIEPICHQTDVRLHYFNCQANFHFSLFK